MEYITKNEFESYKFNLRKLLKSKAKAMQVKTRTLTGDLDLFTYDHRVQFIDAGGSSRTVYLPPVFELDGSPWLAPVKCTSCGCPPYLHIIKEPFPTDCYFYIFNTADAAEDLTIKYKKKVYLTQSTPCNGSTHNAPVYQSESEVGTVMTVSQDEGGVCFSNGIIWRGFVGGTS